MRSIASHQFFLNIAIYEHMIFLGLVVESLSFHSIILLNLVDICSGARTIGLIERSAEVDPAIAWFLECCIDGSSIAFVESL